MMAQLGRAMPAGLNAPRQWSYQPGQLRLQDFKPGAEEQQRMQQTLATHGYLLRAEGDAWLMSIATKPGGQP
jgi:general secretion pathway protein L